MCGLVGWHYMSCWLVHILLRTLTNQKTSERQYMYVIRFIMIKFLKTSISVILVMTFCHFYMFSSPKRLPTFLLCREFCMFSILFQNMYKYLRNVASWSQGSLTLTLQRLVVIWKSVLWIYYSSCACLQTATLCKSLVPSWFCLALPDKVAHWLIPKLNVYLLFLE